MIINEDDDDIADLEFDTRSISVAKVDNVLQLSELLNVVRAQRRLQDKVLQRNFTIAEIHVDLQQ